MNVHDWYNYFNDGIVEIVSDNSAVNAIYYVAGALAKMEMVNKSCQCCKSLLQVEDHPDNPWSSEEDIHQFFNQLNRSGLVRPSDFMFTVLSK